MPTDLELSEDACPMCGGQGIALGTLGYMLQLRCRQCGWDWSVEAPDLQEEPDRD